MFWRRPEPVFDREDVSAVHAGMLDIRRELSLIRRILEEERGDDDQETDE